MNGSLCLQVAEREENPIDDLTTRRHAFVLE